MDSQARPLPCLRPSKNGTSDEANHGHPSGSVALQTAFNPIPIIQLKPTLAVGFVFSALDV